ncbi:hypothetical protein LXM50_08475 [Microbacterium sp. Au-Mic1]|uniref:hypothetical protein n=1 Tax=Microbacterium sp. Au-Mic1 TaxID=2906457 RepID=UPI001E3C184B|nr:hypothetical protein [Microbacterium sp. Au-Mic1]MCE4026006.1 hypothetical protein [Microbacterium sp. Au-Mic1]
MSTEGGGAIPYPLPRNWRDRGMGPLPVTAMVIMAAVAAGLLTFGALHALGGDVLGAILATVFYGALMAGFSVAREGGRRRIRGPVLMNAVTLTRADSAPPDSWVHFFREGLASWALGWGLLLGGAGSVVLLAMAGIRAVAIDAGGWLLLIVPLGLCAGILVLCGVIALIIAFRSASFARIPIGLSIGRSGVSRYYLDAIESVRWEDIRSIAAVAREEDDTEGSRSVLIEREGRDPWRIGVDEYPTPPWVIYAALRFWLEHPADRGELSSTFAQRRIQEWCAAAQDPDARRAASEISRGAS